MESEPTTAEVSPEEPSRPPERNPRQRLLAIAAVAVLGVAGLLLGARLLAAAVGGGQAQSPTAGVSVEVTIPIGASARAIAALLDDAGVVDADDLERAVRDRGAAGRLRAGSYALETGMPADAVVAALIEGPNLIGENSVIVIEGHDVRRVIAGLSEQTGYSVEEFERALVEGQVTSSFLPAELAGGVDLLTRWEGLLFPARYEIAEDASPAEILMTIAAELERRAGQVEWSGVERLGLSPYQAMIVASLIQREAGVEADRPLIASVVYNRLEKDMPLQIDATVVYALGESPGRVLAEHLEIDSPYNTYRHRGLPPTPISTFQIESLQAAARPADTTYLFYVLATPEGAHAFSETYEEHQAKAEQARADGVLP